MTTVVNAKDVTPEQWASGDYVYAGRGGWSGKRRLPRTQWANSWKIGTDGTREEVVAKHREYVLDQVRHSNYGQQIRDTFRGRFIVCHCKPLGCHCDVYAEIANEEHS